MYVHVWMKEGEGGQVDERRGVKRVVVRDRNTEIGRQEANRCVDEMLWYDMLHVFPIVS